jgi:hypothetical protein
VKEWLAALGPANQRLPKIEAALKALPITATDAQIARIVAPVAGLIKPIEALVPRAPSAKTTSLEAIAVPTISNPQGCYADATYKSVSQGAILAMGGKTYSRGFQLTTDYNSCRALWTWHIGGSFATFKALIGLNATDTIAASVSFLGPDQKPLSFNADGQSVTVLNLVSGVPTNVTLSITGDQNFVIQMFCAHRGTSALIDLANDTLIAS